MEKLSDFREHVFIEMLYQNFDMSRVRRAALNVCYPEDLYIQPVLLVDSIELNEKQKLESLYEKAGYETWPIITDSVKVYERLVRGMDLLEVEV